MEDRHAPDRLDRRRPLVGETIGERIRDAVKRSGLPKSEVARRMGLKGPAGYRTLHRWTMGTTTGKAGLSVDNLRSLAEGLGVTTDELLGIAVGQDPPFGSWREFLQTPEGRAATEVERRGLRSFAWAPGDAPTVAAYQLLLVAGRMTTPRDS